MMKLLMKPNGWKREFLRPSGANQIGQAWIDGDASAPVEIVLRLPESHHVMSIGWQERARQAAERKLNEDPRKFASVISLDLSELVA